MRDLDLIALLFKITLITKFYICNFNIMQIFILFIEIAKPFSSSV